MMAAQVAPADPAPLARVLVCDDSATVRAMISRILEACPAIRVVAHAADGRAALQALAVHDIDVVVLDIEMPIMDGLTALPKLLALRPGLTVIMASSLTTRGADATLRALRLGAADYVPKPRAGQGDAPFGAALTAKILGLTKPRPARSTKRAPTSIGALQPGPRQAPCLLAIGSSTGGPNALFSLVASLGPRLGVPVIITQHMPAAFTPQLAEHLNRLGGMPCREARDGIPLVAGEILLAPGNFHLLLRAQGGGLRAHLSQSAPENFCRPSVDAMLRSAAEATDGRVLAVILTGMGSDGLEGARSVVAQGGAALVQDEASSVVWGMPGAVARAGLAHAVLPLPQIGPRILRMLGGNP